jgi:hypothetical protein
MWSYLPVKNLIDLQRDAAIEALDLQIAEDYANGYMVEVDRHLDRRLGLMTAVAV